MLGKGDFPLLLAPRAMGLKSLTQPPPPYRGVSPRESCRLAGSEEGVSSACAPLPSPWSWRLRRGAVEPLSPQRQAPPGGEGVKNGALPGLERGERALRDAAGCLTVPPVPPL